MNDTEFNHKLFKIIQDLTPEEVEQVLTFISMTPEERKIELQRISDELKK